MTAASRTTTASSRGKFDELFNNPEQWIPGARAWAGRVCAGPGKVHWDYEDLVGDILLYAVRFGKSEMTYGEFGTICKWATAKWFAKRLGDKGQKKEINGAISLSSLMDLIEKKGIEESKISLGEEPDHADLSNCRVDLMHIMSMLPRRESEIVRLTLEGYKMSEISKMLGISHERSRQLWKKRVEPLLHMV